MATIARRALLATPLLLRAADAQQEVADLLGEIAAELSAGNANGVLKRVSDTMPERDLFEKHLRGLLTTSQVATSIEFRAFQAESGVRATAKLDWFLEIRRDGYNSVLSTQRRRQIVQCAFEKAGKRWKLAGVEPVSFFAPPAI